MNYAILFSVMGTALLFFMYKSFYWYSEYKDLRDALIGVAIGELKLKVNRRTKEVSFVEINEREA